MFADIDLPPMEISDAAINAPGLTEAFLRLHTAWAEQQLELADRDAALADIDTTVDPVAEAQRFYKIALSDVIVCHDELDLAAAKIRVKLGGGNAGHNGLRSITAQCGNDYRRVRLGIGHPGDKALVHAYVLNDFAKSEEPWVEDLCRAVADEIALLAANENESFQNKVHLAMVGRGWADVKRPGEKAAKN